MILNCEHTVSIEGSSSTERELFFRFYVLCLLYVNHSLICSSGVFDQKDIVDILGSFNSSHFSFIHEKIKFFFHF